MNIVAGTLLAFSTVCLAEKKYECPASEHLNAAFRQTKGNLTEDFYMPMRKFKLENVYLEGDKWRCRYTLDQENADYTRETTLEGKCKFVSSRDAAYCTVGVDKDCTVICD